MGIEGHRAYLATCRQLGCVPQRVLWDAFDAAAFGGTGRRADWDLAAQWAASGELPPLVLAGGLKPDSVAQAIAAVRPAAVDTASGVESSPGRKDAEAVRRFVAAARQAFDNFLPSD
jgi:phosphoribosylanthranilate isomerase